MHLHEAAACYLSESDPAPAVEWWPIRNVHHEPRVLGCGMGQAQGQASTFDFREPV